MLFSLLFHLYLGVAHAGKPPCVLVLENPAQVFTAPEIRILGGQEWLSKASTKTAEFPVSILENRAFREFLSEQNHPWETMHKNSAAQREWAVRFALSKWSEWEALSDSHRDALLAMELRSLSPSTDSPILKTDGRAQLIELSRNNLARMIDQLPRILPLAQGPGEYAAAITDMVAKLQLSPAAKTVADNVYGTRAPLVSDLLLENIGLIQSHPSTDTYFAGRTSPSVALKVLGGNPDGKAVNLPYGRANVVIDKNFVNRFGFVTPAFFTAGDLIEFFRIWEPEALTPFFRSNRFALPADIGDLDELQVYERLTGETLFPPEDFLRSLRVLRARMHKYVLTMEDADTFMRAALQRWLIRQASLSENGSFRYYLSMWNSPSRSEELFRTKFLPGIGWMEGIHLRVPGSVPGSKQSLPVDPAP